MKCGIITLLISYNDCTAYLYFLALILPTPRKDWICFNTNKYLICNSILNIGKIRQPYFLLVLHILTLKEDSPSANSVSHQGVSPEILPILFLL